MQNNKRNSVYYKAILENKIKNDKEFREHLYYPITVQKSNDIFLEVYETIKEYVKSNQTLLNEILEENSYMPNKKVVSDTTTIKNEIPRLFETKEENNTTTKDLDAFASTKESIEEPNPIKVKEDTQTTIMKPLNLTKKRKATTNANPSSENIAKEVKHVIIPKYNIKIWLNFRDYEKYLVDKERLSTAEDLYLSKCYENYLLVNYVKNKEIFETEPQFSKGLKWEEVYHYSPVVISDITKQSSNLNHLANDYNYFDFTQSEEIKGKEVFELIREYEKGTATKKYLDNFIKLLKEDINQNYENVAEEQIDILITKALKEWSWDKKDIPLFTKKFPFTNNIVIECLLEEENYFRPRKEWFEYRIPLSSNDDLKDLKTANTDEEIKKILLRTLPEDLYELSNKLRDEDEEIEKFWVTQVYKREYTKENTKFLHSEISFALETVEEVRIKDFGNFPTMHRYVKEQDKFIFEHNMKILESKKNKIIEYFLQQGIETTLPKK